MNPSRTRDDYLEALVEPDPFRARALVRAAVDGGMDVPTAFGEVLEPAMVEIGRRWEAGELSVAHEHLASEVTASLVSELGERIRRPAESGRLAIVSCSPGERHCIGGQMVAALLAADGWEVLYLGATLPLDDLVGLADSEVPDLVALSTTMPERLTDVREAVPALQDLAEPPLVAVGGQAYPHEDLAHELGADVYARSAADLPLLLRERVPPAA